MDLLSILVDAIRSPRKDASHLMIGGLDSRVEKVGQEDKRVSDYRCSIPFTRRHCPERLFAPQIHHRDSRRGTAPTLLMRAFV